jgi:Leucine-rich repeat (LRR) protein
MNLDQLYNKHKVLKIPDFPENDDFAEWIERLIEVDAYYSGIAASLVGGKKTKIDRSELDELIISFSSFSSIKRDVEVFDQCDKYLRSLKKLIEEASQ